MIRSLIQREISVVVNKPQQMLVPAIALCLSLFLFSYLVPDLWQDHAKKIIYILISLTILSQVNSLAHDYEKGFVGTISLHSNVSLLFFVSKFLVHWVFWSLFCLLIIIGIESPHIELTIIHSILLIGSILAINMSLQSIVQRLSINGGLIYLLGFPLLLPSFLMSLKPVDQVIYTHIMSHGMYALFLIFTSLVIFRSSIICK